MRNNLHVQASLFINGPAAYLCFAPTDPGAKSRDLRPIPLQESSAYIATANSHGCHYADDHAQKRLMNITGPNICIIRPPGRQEGRRISHCSSNHSYSELSFNNNMAKNNSPLSGLSVASQLNYLRRAQRLWWSVFPPAGPVPRTPRIMTTDPKDGGISVLDIPPLDLNG